MRETERVLFVVFLCIKCYINPNLGSHLFQYSSAKAGQCGLIIVKISLILSEEVMIT